MTKTARTRRHADDMMNITDLQELVKGVDGLTAGYIGNFERWGDNRTFYIWTEVEITDGFYAGNKVKLFSCNPKEFTRRKLAEASLLVKAYTAGYVTGAKRNA